MRRTKIICTIGPSSQDEDMLRKIILAGMNVARFNFSHGDYEEHGLKLERTRKISRELNLPVAVLLDTRGPEIRLRDFAEGKVELKAGQKFTLTTEESATTWATPLPSRCATSRTYSLILPRSSMRRRRGASR